MDREATTEPYTNVIFRVSVDLRDRFKAVAAAEQRTMSQELRYLMEKRLEEEEPA